jgi:Transglycosylase SLT domain
VGRGEIPSRVRIPTCPPENNLNLIQRTLALIACVAPLFANAQTFQEYVQLRKQYGITHAADVEAIEAFVGKRILEVKGTVKGVIGAGDSKLLMVEGPSRVQHFIKAQTIPDWLLNGQIQVRLIIDAERASETSMLDATLLGAATEQDVAALEAKYDKPKATKTPRPAISGPITSRKGSRPGRLPGNVPNATTNPVGEPAPGMTSEMLRVLPQYTAFIKNRNKKLTDEDAEHIAEGILAYSAHFGVDARLIVAIIVTESDFNPMSTSNKGAKGLGQLMPVNERELGLTNAYDINQNLWGTVKLVRGHIDKYSAMTNDSFEALVLALAGYNAGNGAVKKFGNQVPPYKETQNYVRKVIDMYSQLCGK